MSILEKCNENLDGREVFGDEEKQEESKLKRKIKEAAKKGVKEDKDKEDEDKDTTETDINRFSARQSEGDLIDIVLNRKI